MPESRQLLQHFLGALAYRTQKALRDAPDQWWHSTIRHGRRDPTILLCAVP
jgi:hypothetical protein